MSQSPFIVVCTLFAMCGSNTPMFKVANINRGFELYEKRECTRASPGSLQRGDIVTNHGKVAEIMVLT